MPAISRPHAVVSVGPAGHDCRAWLWIGSSYVEVTDMVSALGITAQVGRRSTVQLTFPFGHTLAPGQLPPEPQPEVESTST